MKKLVLFVGAVMIALGANAQGVVTFRNFVPGELEQPIFAADGSTRLAGDQFQAELLAGASEGDLSPVSGSQTGFATGNGAGFFLGPDVSVDGIGVDEDAVLQVRAWDTQVGSSFSEAQSAGAGFGTSGSFTVTLGGEGGPPPPGGEAPPDPALMSGFESFSLVPEPSVFALGLLGIGAVFFRRWMK